VQERNGGRALNNKRGTSDLRRGDWKLNWAKNKEAQAHCDKSWKRPETIAGQQQNSTATGQTPGAHQGMEAAKIEVGSRSTTFEELGAKAKRREGAEQRAGDVEKRRGEMEAALARTKESEHGCSRKLEQAQKNSTRSSKFRRRPKQAPGANQGIADGACRSRQKVASLTETLTQESKRREGAEHQANELGKRRMRTRSRTGQEQRCTSAVATRVGRFAERITAQQQARVRNKTSSKGELGI